MSRVKFLKAVIILGLLVLLVLPSMALAQGDIQIGRPLDGATVRETVNILVPAASVPKGGFVSYSVDGQFKTASYEQTADKANYVFRWDSKEIDPDTNLKMEQRLPHDGKRIISVQAYDKNGIKSGKSKQITIYVKNNASADMPASGLKLEYRYIPGASARYKIHSAITVKSIQGDTSVASKLGIIGGKEFVFKRTVEDIVSRNTAMIRQRFDGNVTDLNGGTPVIDTSIVPKSSYRIEDAHGNVSSVIHWPSSGKIVTVDMPKLPVKRIKIGDTWTLKQRILRDPLSEDSAGFSTVNTLEGLEWEGGYPCAKIKTSFTGSVKIPDTTLVKDDLTVTGETITYFAYRIGKMITSTTTATAELTVDASTASSLTSRTSKSSSGGTSTMPGGNMMMPGGMPTMPGGNMMMPGGMPTMPGGNMMMPGGMPTMPGMSGGISSGSESTSRQDVNIQIELTRKIQLLR